MASRPRTGAERQAAGVSWLTPPNMGRRKSDRPLPVFIRVATLCALLGLALYTAMAAIRLSQQPAAGTAEVTGTVAGASLLAARADGEISTLRAATYGAAEIARRGSGDPLDAAEAGMEAARGAAIAVAIIGDQDILAQKGAAPPADLRAAAERARQSTDGDWVGSIKGGQRIYAAETVMTRSGRLTVVAAADPSRLIPRAGRGEALAIATVDGPLLAVKGGGGVDQATTLMEAFSVGPANLALSDGLAQTRGRLPNGAPVEVVIRLLDGGRLVAAAATEIPPAAAEGRRLYLTSLLAILFPLVIGTGLAMLLVRQSRRAQEAQDAFRASEERFRLAVESARCGIWEWDLKADKVLMSDVTGLIMGWGGGGLVSGRELLERTAPDHRERLRQALAAAAKQGAFDVSFRVPDRNGRSAWIDARGQGFGPDPDGGFTRITGVAMDVTEERVAQARAQSAETRLRDAIESASEAFVLWDRSGRLLMCNSNYRNFFSLEARLLKPGASRETVERFAQLAVKRSRPKPEGRKGEREAELNDGRWVQISERRTADGGLVMTAADVTAIKHQEESRRRNELALQAVVDDLEKSRGQLAELARKYEDEKIRAEGANKAKSDFLANMSHELRTPLNAINGFSEIMVGELFGSLGDPRYKDYAKDILDSGQHLLAVINDILDMSKIEAGKMNLKFDPIDLGELAEDAMRLMRNRADSAGLQLFADLSDLPEIEADYRALKQILLNLLSNALEVHAPRRTGDNRRPSPSRLPGRRAGAAGRAGHRHRHLARGHGSVGAALRAGGKPALQEPAGHRPRPCPDQIPGRNARRNAQARERTGQGHPGERGSAKKSAAGRPPPRGGPRRLT